MNKLTHGVKLGLLVSSLVILPIANAAKNSSQTMLEEAKEFIEAADIDIKKQTDTLNLSWYIKDRFMTLDTLNHWGNLREKAIATEKSNAYAAIQYKDLNLNDDLTRRLNNIILVASTYPSHPHPENEQKITKLKKLTDDLTKLSAANTACIDQERGGETCLNAQQISEKMVNSTDESELKSLWKGWHNNLAPLKPIFEQQMQLNNEGAQRFGFSNRAEMQLSEFEMPVDDFIIELDQVWADIMPLYYSLMSHVRNKLIEKYGTNLIKPNQPIPAHFLGSLNVKNLSNLYDLVKPDGAVIDRGYNITKKLKENPELDVPTMLHGLEKYMISMGFSPFKKSLYEFSQFTKPEHHNAACDSTSWWLAENEEARVGGCWDINENTFMRFNTTSLLTPTYFRAAHKEQPGHYSIWPAGTFRGTGRALQYAYTPDYLQSIGMLDEIPDESVDLGYLMKLALNTVASLPYKLAVNKWQKEVATGEITTKEYNKRWWELREQYQGIAAPISRSDNDFDAGSATEIILNQSQAGSFISEVLGFQFYQSLCEAADNKNILSRCSFYDSKEIGTKLQAMFELGNSRPWYEVMSEITGQTKLDGKAVVDYFAPLQKYLDRQNKS
jgi:peptidyl-dipeptidase A